MIEVFIIMALCCLLSGGLIALGYWMGRNSIGKPFSDIPIFQGLFTPDRKQILEDYDPWKEAELTPVDAERHKHATNTVR